ncbi:MAG: FkbM family methyltransferase [Acidimicrobiia bacterium]
MALHKLIATGKQSLKHLVDAMDRPALRPVVGVAATGWATARYRRSCRVRWADGMWTHTYSDLTIPGQPPGRAPSPEKFLAEVDEVFTYAYRVKPGDVVFDVGAGIGAETLAFSRAAGPTGKVVSIEAHPGTFAMLRSLCQLNGLGNVTPLDIAAADAEGELIITDVTDHVTNSVMSNDATDGARVKARRLDAVAEELGVDHIDFLKVNIEGAEVLALPGMGSLIDRTANVCISCHDFLADQGGSDAMRTKAFVRGFLTDHGFAVISRDDSPKPWIRDYLYGARSSA